MSLNISQRRLIELLDEGMFYDDVAVLATKLDINIDKQISGKSKLEKIRGLVELLAQQNRITKLVSLVEEIKPQLIERELFLSELEGIRQQVIALKDPSDDQKIQLMQSVSDIERSHNSLEITKEKDLQQIQDERDLYALRARILLGLLFVIICVELLFFLPWFFDWQWLNSHPRKIGIYATMVVVITAIGWAIADKKRRAIALSTVAAGALLQILQLI